MNSGRGIVFRSLSALFMTFALALALFTPSSRAQGRPPSSLMLEPHPAKHTHPFVDGGIDPTLIRAETAYRMFLRMLSTLGASDNDAALRSYIAYALTTGAAHRHAQATVEACVFISKSAEVDAFIKMLSTYDIHSIRSNELAAERLRAELPHWIGSESAADIESFVMQVVRRRIKIISK